MNKSDSKYNATAKRMDNALLLLLKKKPFESITVSELCIEAGVHRSTFYLHYENINDLLEETVRYLLDNFLSYFEPELYKFIDNLPQCELSQLNLISDKYLIPYLIYVKENQEVFKIAHSHEKAIGLYDASSHLYDRILVPILERFHYPQNDYKYIVLYYVNGIHAITMEWLQEGCIRSADDIAKIIRVCVFGLNGNDPFSIKA